MIARSDILQQWFDVCPSFREPLSVSLCEYGENQGEELLYVHAGEFAAHLLSLYRARTLDEFAAVGAWIERLHVDGDQYVREFATIGILEGIQNVWSHSEIHPDEFLPFLGPVSLTAWHDLNRFWNGEIPYVPDSQNQ